MMMTNKIDWTSHLIDLPTLGKTQSGGEIKMRRTLKDRTGRCRPRSCSATCRTTHSRHS